MTEIAGQVGVELEVMISAVIPAPLGYVYRARGGTVARLRAILNFRGEKLELPCSAYAIRHPSAGWLLIDTGLHREVRRGPRKEFGLPMGLVFGRLRPVGLPFDEQLRELGIEPREVRSVVMTHLHADHTSGMRLLTEAIFTCARPEWSVTRMRSAGARGYVRKHLPPDERVKLVDFSTVGEPFGPFPRTIDLFGDGSVRLIDTAGHSPGHMSVLLRLTDGSRVLLVGDAAYTLRNINEQILPGLSIDDETSRQSLRALKAFADDDPASILVPSHDPDAWRALPTSACRERPTSTRS